MSDGTVTDGTVTEETQTDEPARCRNCGRELSDAFCPRCGQKAEHWLKPLGEMVGELADGFLAFDARIWRTLGPLVLRPGFLTLEYFAGRRVRYVPPLRLYLFFSFVFFLTLALLPSRDVVVGSGEGGTDLEVGAVQLSWNEGGGGGAGTSIPGLKPENGREPPKGGEADPETAPDSTGAAELQEAGVEGPDDDSGPWSLITDEKVEKIVADPERFYRAFSDRLAQIAFVLVPLFAAYSRLFYWRRRDHLYAHHLVFSLHLHAFGFAAVWLGHLTGLLPGGFSRVGELFGLAVLVYVPLAMKRVYGQRWAWTLLKFSGLGLLYGLTLGLASLAAVLLALRAW